MNCPRVWAPSPESETTSTVCSLTRMTRLAASTALALFFFLAGLAAVVDVISHSRSDTCVPMVSRIPRQSAFVAPERQGRPRAASGQLTRTLRPSRLVAVGGPDTRRERWAGSNLTPHASVPSHRCSQEKLIGLVWMGRERRDEEVFITRWDFSASGYPEGCTCLSRDQATSCGGHGRRRSRDSDGQGGIRTHGTLARFTRSPGVCLQPLGHLSKNIEK